MLFSVNQYCSLRLKMANTSVRIECIHLPANKSSLSIRLGYILLKVKEAQTVNPTSYDRVSNIDLIL